VFALERSYFHVNLCTYQDLATLGAPIADFVEMGIHLAQRARIPLRVSIERKALGLREKKGQPLSERTWDRARQALLDGTYAYLFVFNSAAPQSFSAALTGGLVRFSLTVRSAGLADVLQQRVRGAAAQARIAQFVRASPRFVNLAVAVGGDGIDLSERDTWEGIVRATRDTFQRLDGACGFITLDEFNRISGDMTPREQARRVYWGTQPDLYQTHLRGAFWANLLSATHVDRLGGFSRVAREAPCYLVEPTLAGGADAGVQGGGAYLQLSETPSRFSEPRLNALERYLEPVLP
jgi:hypothetical protein